MSDWEDNSNQRENGRGRGGGRGRGRGRGGSNRNNDFDSPQEGNDGWGNGNSGGWGDNNYKDNDGSRGRGGRGGSRGRGGDKFSDRNASGEGTDGDDLAAGDQPVSDKPRPTYIPPEIDDNDCKGVEVGTNFNQYEHIQVKVKGDNVPKHIESFKSSGLREVLLEKLGKCNYTIPTPIQKYSIPVVVSGRDLMASAQTGSGKTVSILCIFNVI